MSCNPIIYLGTGGYSDTDLLGTLYPPSAKVGDFLHHYANHYDCVEINSTFHALVGQKSLQGMLNKASGRLQFIIKLHQQFSHHRNANRADANAFLTALEPLITQNVLTAILVQFPANFIRTPTNRHYLSNLVEWLAPIPLALEFRSPSWHIAPVFAYFAKSPNLIWVNADYPTNISLPNTSFWANTRTAYYRLHGRNRHWHTATSAKQRHDYRYHDDELAQLANTIFDHRYQFDKLFVLFENTTHAHSFYNINSLKQHLSTLGFVVKIPTLNQGQLF